MKYGLPLSADECQRRSPCGERGLKLEMGTQGPIEMQSLPVRGAWIEIMCRSDV